MNDDQTPKDEGSVWASYSDLFTNVAIIFLVMFVFALLKSGLSKMETALVKKQHQEELRGKLTQKEVEISQEKIKKVESSIKEMMKVETLVDEKIKEIQEFAKSMEENKKILNDLIEEQKKKDSLLNVVNKSLSQKEEVIKNLESQTKKLEEMIKTTEIKKNVLEETIKKTALKSQGTLVKISNLEKQLNTYKKEKKEKESEMINLTQLVNVKMVTIDGLEKQNSDLSDKIKSTENSVKNLQENKAYLEKKIVELDQSKSKMKKELSKLEQKFHEEGLKGKSLFQKLTQSEHVQDDLKKTIGKLNQDMDGKLGEINHLKGLHDKSQGEAQKLKGILEETQLKMRDLGRALMDMKGKLRSSVADSLKRKFGNQNLNVNVDKDSGNITLLMDDNFLFQKNSHELSDKAQETLGKIAPIYSEVIFGDQQIKERIEKIEITGHASPSYKKNYVDPKKDHPDAYAYNMRLSAMRAASIANFLVGKKIGNYHFKEHLRESIYAVGRSYISPVEKTNNLSRGIAAEGETFKEVCGPYDCELSQRVEIGFRLKEDMKAIEKIINMAGAK
jgi:outer membrane protein OmpA-like peptidoglycan-associated protein